MREILGLTGQYQPDLGDVIQPVVDVRPELLGADPVQIVSGNEDRSAQVDAEGNLQVKVSNPPETGLVTPTSLESIDLSIPSSTADWVQWDATETELTGLIWPPINVLVDQASWRAAAEIEVVGDSVDIFGMCLKLSASGTTWALARSDTNTQEIRTGANAGQMGIAITPAVPFAGGNTWPTYVEAPLKTTLTLAPLYVDGPCTFSFVMGNFGSIPSAGTGFVRFPFTDMS